jgi:ketosteroid isomerase-like protein
MVRLVGAVAVAWLAWASACRPASSAGTPAASADPPPLAAADLAAIRATDSAFAGAAGAGDAASLAALYLADARLMPPNAPTVEGREAVRKFWGAVLDAYTVRFDIASEEIEGRGDLAYARGRYTLDGTPKARGGAPLHDEGTFLEVLRREADGSWRYAVDMYSSDLPVAR